MAFWNPVIEETQNCEQSPVHCFKCLGQPLTHLKCDFLPKIFQISSLSSPPLYCLYAFQLFITSGAFWSSRIIVAGEAISSSFNKPSRQTGNRSIRLSIFRPFQMLEQFRWITSNRKSLWVLISQEAGVMMNAWKQRQKQAFWKPKASLSVYSRDSSLNPHSSVDSPKVWWME